MWAELCLMQARPAGISTNFLVAGSQPRLGKATLRSSTAQQSATCHQCKDEGLSIQTSPAIQLTPGQPACLPQGPQFCHQVACGWATWAVSDP